MKHYQCENCGAELVKNGDEYVCEYCKRTYADDSLEKAYEKVCQTLQSTVQNVVSAEFLRAKIEKIASCRQGLYKARTGEYIDNDDINFWSKQILKLLPEDPQANFYEIASAERWSELNKYLKNFDVKENGYLLDGFVDFLTNGRVVEQCVLRLNDLIAKAFKETSDEYKNCHKKIVEATEKAESGIFDPSLPRDVFVAYSSKDSEKAYALVEYLEERGLNCFISMRNLPKGVNAERYYEERLEQAIDNCQVFLFVSSKNSRSRNCDAYTKEIKHVKELDLQRYSVDERNYWNTHYDEFDKRNGKPRVEFIVEEYGNSIYEIEVAKFFRGLSWCTDKASVLTAVTEYVTGNPIAEKRAKIDEIAKQKAEFERKQADFERQKAEFEKQKADELARQREEIERQKADELARQQAEIERQKAEFEKQRAELERQKEEFKKSSAEKPKVEQQNVEQHKAEQPKSPETPDLVIENGVLKRYNGTDRKVVIPQGVTEIGANAFEAFDRYLESVKIPSTVKIIGESAFRDTQIETLQLPAWLEKIGKGAFWGCGNLKSIIIPSSVIEIGNSAFLGCQNLKISAEVKEKPSGWANDWNSDNRPVEWGYTPPIPQLRKSRSPISGLKETLENPSITKENLEKLTPVKPVEKPEFEIENGVLKKYNGTGGNVIIPDNIKGIGEYAFVKCNTLTGVVIPNSVNYISESAFGNCENLTYITIPNSVISIGWAAFCNCKALTRIVIPISVTSIAESVFEDCSQLTIFAEAKEKPSGWNEKWNSSNRPVEWGYKKLPAFTTKGCDYSIKSPAQAKKMFEIELAEMKKRQAEEKAKQQAQDTQIPQAATEIRYTKNGVSGALATTNARKVPIGQTLKQSLEKLNQTEKNGAQSQATTSNSSQGEIPPLTKVKPSARGVELALNPLINKADFEIENGVLKKYKGAGGFVVIPDGVTGIGAEAFHDSKVTNVKIPYGVRTIGKQAFFECKNLERVSLPSTITKIAYGAFQLCEKLTSIAIPEKVTVIEVGIFHCCSKLSEIILHSNIEKIETLAFRSCLGLKTIKIPASIKIIEDDVFENCPNLTIYAEAEKKPKGWVHSLFGKENWNPDNRPVKWGYKG